MSVLSPFGTLMAVALLTGVLSSCAEPDSGSVVTPDLLRLETNQVVIGLETFVTTEGVRKAHLVGDTAFFPEDASRVDLTGVRVTFYGSQGEVSSILTSKEGTYDWETGDMVGRGDVVVLDPDDGRRVETQVMHYDRNAERIWSDAPTRVFEADGTEIEGTAFESDPGLDEVNLESARLVRPGARTSTPP